MGLGLRGTKSLTLEEADALKEDVPICKGDENSKLVRYVGNARVFKDDIGNFREVVSASNDTDYQARSLNIRYRAKDGNKFAHTLNSTAKPARRASTIPIITSTTIF